MRTARASCLCVLPLLILALPGCPPVAALPETFDVAITAAEKRPAEKDTGPASFADSRWRAFRKADPDEDAALSELRPGPYGGLLGGGALQRPPAEGQIFIVEFGDNGRMTGVSENLYFLSKIYGQDVPVGGSWVPTGLPGVTFRSASYGMEDGNRYGLAVVVQVGLNGAYVGRAVLYTWGTRDGDRIDGQFGYLLDFEGGLGSALLSTVGDQYEFFAERIP